MADNGVKTIYKITGIIRTDSPVLHQRIDAVVYEVFDQNPLSVFCNIDGWVEGLPLWLALA